MKSLIDTTQHTNPLLIYLLLTAPMGTLIVQILSACASVFIILNQAHELKRKVDTHYGGKWQAYLKSFFPPKK